jgi:hypothetical protein
MESSRNIEEYQRIKFSYDLAFVQYNNCQNVMNAFKLIEDECYMTNGKPDKLKAQAVYDVGKDVYEKAERNLKDYEDGMVKSVYVFPFDEDRCVWLATSKSSDDKFTTLGEEIPNDELSDVSIIRVMGKSGLKFEKRMLKFIGDHEFFLDSRLHVMSVYTVNIHDQTPQRNESSDINIWTKISYDNLDDYKFISGLGHFLDDVKGTIKGTRIIKSKKNEISEVNVNGKRSEFENDENVNDIKRSRLE